MPIHEGKQAPDFTLRDSRGTPHSLRDFRDRNVLLYFYPQDDTPGCTKEACGFRDLHDDFSRLGALVIGISPDTADSHSAFISKYNLPFLLLCDPDKSVMRDYGAYGEKNLYGKTVVGVIRSSVLIRGDGTIVKHWKKVAKAESHPAQVLQALRELPTP